MGGAGAFTAEQRDRLAHKLAALIRDLGHGSPVYHVSSGMTAAWSYAPAEVGHDALVVLVPVVVRRESDGDRLAACLAAVDDEVERYANRLALRRYLGLPERSTDGQGLA